MTRGSLIAWQHPVSGPICLARNHLPVPALAPGNHAGPAELWHEVAIFKAFFQHPSTGVGSPRWNLDMSSPSRALPAASEQETTNPRDRRLTHDP